MKITEIRDLTLDQLDDQLAKLKKEQFNLRFQRASGQLENTARIRMHGFNLSIDDFGTAYSSLMQLSRIPFSELKIERAFVSGIDRDTGKQAIVRSCAQLGRSLGLHVVAEGVETREEYEAVGRLGCTEVQGWLIGKPMPVAQAVEWLRALPDQRFAV